MGVVNCKVVTLISMTPDESSTDANWLLRVLLRASRLPLPTQNSFHLEIFVDRIEVLRVILLGVNETAYILAWRQLARNCNQQNANT